MLPLDTIYHMDALELLKQLPDGCIDMILCDLPYGTTACAWDEIIPFEPMWEGFKRLIKPRGAIVLTASQPFTSKLVMSNLDWFRCEWIWSKGRGVNFANANRHPMKAHENILIFSQYATVFNPQWWYSTPYKVKNGKRKNSIEGLGGGDSPKKHRPETISVDGRRYPLSIIESRINTGLHPTQKPVALFEYLIRTYTQPGEIILDPCVGSGTTAIAARNTGRQFICGDKEFEYVNIARERLAKPYTEPMFVE